MNVVEWALIFYIASMQSGGPSTLRGFHSKEACEQGYQQIVEDMDASRTIIGTKSGDTYVHRKHSCVPLK